MATWKVRALNTGVYGHLREAGEEFEISDRKDAEGKVIPVDRVFSKRWMERIVEEEAIPVVPEKKKF